MLPLYTFRQTDGTSPIDKWIGDRAVRRALMLYYIDKQWRANNKKLTQLLYRGYPKCFFHLPTPAQLYKKSHWKGLQYVTQGH